MSLTITKNKESISAEDLFGFGMPTINIVSTELVSDNSVLKAKQDPHIDHPGELNVKSLSQIEDANENRSLKVNLKLSFKETIDPNGDFAYISAGEDLKYFKVAVFQSLDENVTNNCNYDTLNPRNGNYFKSTAAVLGLSKRVGSPGTNLQNIVNLVLSEVQSSQIQGSDIDLGANSLINQIPYAKTQDSFGNILYNIPLEFSFEINPKEGGTNPEHLAYFVFAYFDIDEYLKELEDVIGQVVTQDDLLDNIADQLDTLIMGNIASDLVIVNGQLQEEAYVFQDANENFYTGPYHQMADGQFMKGAYHKSGKTYKAEDFLKKITVPNSKIIDNRQVAKLDKVDYNYAKVADFLINPDVIASISNPGTENLFKVTYPVFSDMWSSKDMTGKNRFLFSINMESLLLQNTVFPGLLRSLKQSEKNGNGSLYSSLLSQLNIKELKITRRRVKKSINFDSKVVGRTYSKSEKPLKIIQTLDNNGKLKSKVETSANLDMKVSTAPKKVGAISEVNIDSMQHEIRTFSCTDINIQEKTDGLYEYTLDIEINDPVPKFLQSKIQELEILLNGTNSITGWKQYLTATKDPKFFDTYANRFNVEFLDFYRKSPSFNTTSGLSFVSDIIYQFVSKVSQLDSKNSLNTAASTFKLASYLEQISGPNTGNPEGAETVAEFMDNTISSLQKLLESTTSYKKLSTLQGVSNPHTKNSTPNLNGSSTSKTFKTSHKFKSLFEAFNSSHDDPYGYDFLSLTPKQLPSNLGGLRVLNVDNFIQRCTLETQKLFLNESVNFDITAPNGIKYNNGDSLLNKKFSFLSPSFVYVPRRRPANLISDDETISEIADLALDIIRYNQDNTLLSLAAPSLNIQNSPKPLVVDLPKDIQKRRFDLVDYFASKGCTFQVEQEPVATSKAQGSTSPFKAGSLFQTPFTATEIADFVSDVSNIFHANSINIINSTVNPNKFLYTMTALKDLDFKINESSFNNFNSLDFYNLSDANSGKKLRKNIKSLGTELLNNLPNHTKSLIFLSKISTDVVGATNPIAKYVNATKKDPFKLPHFFPYINFNYRFLNRIQVFDGFESVGEMTLIKGNGKWRDLSLSKLNQIQNGQETTFYLCRQVRYKDNFSVRTPRILEMPIYDKYFLLTKKDVSIFQNSDSFAAFFANDVTSNGTLQGLANQQVTNSLLNSLLMKEKKKISKTLKGGFLKTEVMQTNIVAKGKKAPNSNEVQGQNDFVGGFAGGPNVGSGVEKDTLEQAKNKEKAAAKLSLLEQAQILESMGLTKMLSGNNVNTSIAKLKNDGTANKETKPLTKDEADLLKKSSVSKQTKDAINKAEKIKPSQGATKAMPKGTGGVGPTGGGSTGGGSTGGSSGGGLY